MGNEIKFKPATFYLGVADYLAKAVEGLKPEDMDAEEGGDVKPGHGEIKDESSQRMMGRVPTEIPHPKVPSTTGKDKVTGPAIDSGSNHRDRATNVSLTFALDVLSPTPLTHEPESHTSHPRRQSQGSGSQDSYPIPAKPHIDE